MPKRSAKSAGLAPSDSGTRAVVVISEERTPPASPEPAYSPASPTYSRYVDDDDDVLVPNSQPWRDSPPASPAPPRAPRSSSSAPRPPLASAPAALPAADSADRITSHAAPAAAVASLARRPAEIDDVLLFLVADPGRVENRVVAAYYSRALQLGILEAWWQFTGNEDRLINSRAPHSNKLISAFMRLSCAHPRISDEHARDFLTHTFNEVYRFALPPEYDRPVKIAGIITIQMND